MFVCVRSELILGSGIVNMYVHYMHNIMLFVLYKYTRTNKMGFILSNTFEHDNHMQMCIIHIDYEFKRP